MSELPVAIHRFQSLNSGPALLVFGAIHGNEVCGTHASERIMRSLGSGKLTLERGSVTFVPIANPRAYLKGVRCVEENLNRIFRPQRRPVSYEAQLANALCPLVDSCDALLDVHTTTAEGRPFIYLDYPTKANRALAEALGPGAAITGWPELYAKLGRSDTALGTTDYAAQCGKDTVLIECGQHRSPKAEGIAHRAILNAMRHYGLIAGKVRSSPMKTIRMTDGYFRAHAADCLAKNWKHLDRIKKGHPMIQHSDGRVTYAPRDAVIIMPKATAPVGDDWLHLGVEKL